MNMAAQKHFSWLYTGGYTEPTVMASGETVPSGCPGIVCYSFDEETGQLTKRSVTEHVPNPSWVLADPNGGFLYCVNELKHYGRAEGSSVMAFRIDPADGSLEYLNEQVTGGADACHLAIVSYTAKEVRDWKRSHQADPEVLAEYTRQEEPPERMLENMQGSQTASGQLLKSVVCCSERRFLICANYSGGSISVFPIRQDGSLEPMSCLMRHHGQGPDRERQEGPHPHQILPTDTPGRFYVSDLGLDRMIPYELNPVSGTLRPANPTFGGAVLTGVVMKPVAVLPGQGCRHGVWSEGGKTLYVMTEMASEVDAIQVDPETGASVLFQTLPLAQKTEKSGLPSRNLGAAIRLHPNGRWLYASVRGADEIVLMHILQNGKLCIEQRIFAGGPVPRDFILSENGRYLLAGSQDGNCITIFSIDPDGGRLSEVSQSEDCGGCTCLTLAGI